jgi:hypothetical protein
MKSYLSLKSSFQELIKYNEFPKKIRYFYGGFLWTRVSYIIIKNTCIHMYFWRFGGTKYYTPL